MSRDQKPARIRMLSSGAARQQELPPASEPAVELGSVPASAGGRLHRLLTTLIFLLGSAGGGAGLAAWSHFAG